MGFDANKAKQKVFGLTSGNKDYALSKLGESTGYFCSHKYHVFEAQTT